MTSARSAEPSAGHDGDADHAKVAAAQAPGTGTLVDVTA